MAHKKKKAKAVKRGLRAAIKEVKGTIVGASGGEGGGQVGVRAAGVSERWRMKTEALSH